MLYVECRDITIELNNNLFSDMEWMESAIRITPKCIQSYGLNEWYTEKSTLAATLLLPYKTNTSETIEMPSFTGKPIESKMYNV